MKSDTKNKNQKNSQVRDEVDPKNENLILHEDLLRAVFNHSFSHEKTTVERSTLERLANDAPLTVKNVSPKRKSEVVRTIVNVLLALNVLTKDVKPENGCDDITLRSNFDQARVLENVDHYCHGKFLLEEYNHSLELEEASLVQQLLARSKTAKGNNGDDRRSAPSRASKRRKTEEATPPPVDPIATVNDMVEPSNNSNLQFVNTIHDRAKIEEAISRIRSLQVLMHTPGAKAAIERAMSGNPDRPKFLPVALGPLGPAEVPVGAQESRGPSSSLRSTSTAESRSGSILSLSTLSGTTDSAGARSDASTNLKPGFEIELKTRALDFAEIAAQFEVWNGQDSEIGVSGRSSPRPSPSPGAESMLASTHHHHHHSHPVPSGSPPPQSSGMPANLNAVVRVPQYTKLCDKELKELIGGNGIEVTDAEKEEEKLLDDGELLKRHDHALEEFRIAYEKEQEMIKQKKKEAREAGERQARDIVAAARARSSSQLATQSASARLSGGGSAHKA